MRSALPRPPDFYREPVREALRLACSGSRRASPRRVAVCQYKDGSRWIQFSDGRGASGTCSYQGGWLYAHLPLLLHPPAAVGGGDLLRHRQHARRRVACTPCERLDGIELSREVVAAAPFFAATNHDVATSGRARIVIEDGRNYLLATRRATT